jgi:hypothetical protein
MLTTLTSWVKYLLYCKKNDSRPSSDDLLKDFVSALSWNNSLKDNVQQ